MDQETIQKKDETIQVLTHEMEESPVYMYLQEGGTLPELIQWGSL